MQRVQFISVYLASIKTLEQYFKTQQKYFQPGAGGSCL
jgi:hypothetical protein